MRRQGTPEDVIRQIKKSTSILEIAESLTRLKKQGKEYVGLCPFHNEKSPSFRVDAEEGLFYCFGCRTGGDVITLHIEATGDDFRTAIEDLARRAGIEIPGQSEQESGPRDALRAADQLFRSKLTEPKPSEHLAKRKVSAEVAEAYGIGYAPPGFGNLIGALSRRFNVDTLKSAGLIGISKNGGKPYDLFRDRLMFPVRSAGGDLCGYSGRTLAGDPAKYYNTPETDLFKKSTLLYGLREARREIRATGRAVLVEGHFDVIACACAGVKNAVASMGTAVNAQHAATLAKYAREVVICFDDDPAGNAAAEKSIPVLVASGLAVRRASLPDGLDPDAFRIERGDEALAEVLEAAPDAILAALEVAGTLADPQERKAAAERLRETIGMVPDPVARRSYAEAAGEAFSVSPDHFAPRIRASPARRAGRAFRVGPQEEAILKVIQAGEVPESAPGAEAFSDPDCRALYALALEYRAIGRRFDRMTFFEAAQARGILTPKSARLMVDVAEIGDPLADLRKVEHMSDRRRFAEIAERIIREG